jgi:tetratricopeptide (TPR) repeat protein
MMRPAQPPPEFPKQAQDLFDKAGEAVEKMNYDYAIALLFSALEVAPDMVQARHLLREAEMRRFDSKKGPAWLRKFFVTIFQSVNFTRGGLCLLTGKWSKAFGIYERVLKAKPRSIHALRRHARAAREMRMLDTAINSLEHARRIRPENLRVIRELGRVQMQKGDVPQAQACFQKLLIENKDDKESAKALQDLAAMGTIIRGDWEDTESYRDKIKDVEFAKTAERETRLVKSKDDVDALIRDHERRLAEQPEKLDNYKTLADLYIQKKEFDKAIQLFDRAIQLAPADADLPDMRFKTVILRFDNEIKQAETEAACDPANLQLQAKAEQVKKDKDAYAVSDLQRRVAQYPTNLNLRLELGLALMKHGKLDEAIKELQVAKTSSQKRAVALNYLGESFRLKGQPDMAVEQFERALSELYVMDSFKKEVMYNLGRAYEDLGDEEKALQQYKQIYAEDIGFRDVNDRVQKAYQHRRQKAAEESGKT